MMRISRNQRLFLAHWTPLCPILHCKAHIIAKPLILRYYAQHEVKNS